MSALHCKREMICCYSLAVVFLAASTVFFASSVASYSNMPSKSLVSPDIAVHDQPQSMEKRPLSDYQIVADRNIFSVLKPNPQPSPPTPVAPPPAASTSIALCLVGTIISPDQTFKAAVIQDSASHKDEFYREGDVAGQVRILKISWGEVLIENNGRQEILPMNPDSDRQPSGGETERRPPRAPAGSRRVRQAAPLHNQ